MTTLISIIAFLTLWVGMGILTLRVLTLTHEGPDEDDENFFLGIATICGPIFTVIVIGASFCVFIGWVIRKSMIPKALRKAAGFR